MVNPTINRKIISIYPKKVSQGLKMIPGFYIFFRILPIQTNAASPAPFV